MESAHGSHCCHGAPLVAADWSADTVDYWLPILELLSCCDESPAKVLFGVRYVLDSQHDVGVVVKLGVGIAGQGFSRH